MIYDDSIIVGWREWVGLPELGIPFIKTKIDTGARTSALHAFYVKPYKRRGEQRVQFGLHPFQIKASSAVKCDAKVIDYRLVTDSGGHREKRYVISTFLSLSGQSWEIEVTLTNRENMKFRMLLGRTAMKKRLIVDPSRSYLQGKGPIMKKFKKRKAK